MSTPPRFSERKPSRASELAPGNEPPKPGSGIQVLTGRLAGMSDRQLVAYQASAIRIGNDPEHAKHAFARRALPLIEAEIRRRTDAARPVKTGPGT